MQYPKTIIELDAFFDEENKKRFIKLMNENEVEIYKAANYADQSDYAGEIYDQMFRILQSEN